MKGATMSRIRNPIALAAAVAGLLLLPAFASAKSGSQEDGEWHSGQAFRWSGAIPKGKAIEIKGVNGGITASLATGSEVEVEATRRARKSDPDEVTIEVIEHADGVTICAKYPAPPGKEENECLPGDKGHMSTRDNDVEVSFRVRVPAGVRLVARTVNGEIDAEGMRGPVEATTVNGAVQISTTSYAQAVTVNGSIVAAIGSATWPEALSFTTVNGRVRITLPAAVNADVRVQTTNGSIETDFPVTVQGRFGRNRLQGAIGKGGQRIEVETVNGNVALRAASS
jgi:hypothetical protein